MTEPGVTLRLGMVGAGMIGQVAHLTSFVQLSGCCVVALAELRPELGSCAARRFGIQRIYPSHRQMIETEELDALVVVTRREATGAIVRDARAAGLHVLCEKPMAHTVAQGQVLVDAAQRRGKVFSVGYMKRHDAGTQLFVRLLHDFRQSGELGRVVFMRCWCFGGEFRCGTDDFVMTDESRPAGLELWPLAPDWLSSERHVDYARFLNVFVHDLNIVRYLAGHTPRVVAADLRRANGGWVAFDFGEYGGVLETADIPFNNWQEGVEVLFEKGRMRLAFPSPMLKNVSASVSIEYARGGTWQPDVPWSWAFRRQAEAFLADIRLGREPLASGKDALGDLALAEEIWRAAAP